MTESIAELGRRALELRRVFDETFAAPPVVKDDDREAVLAIRAAGVGYGVRLKEIRNLFADRKIVPMRNRLPEFLGLAGARGAVIPVYSMAALLGRGPGASEDTPRWLIVAGFDQLVGFAFEEFEGHLEVSRSMISSAEGAASSVHVREALRYENAHRPIVSIESLIAAVRSRIGAIKEH